MTWVRRIALTIIAAVAAEAVFLALHEGADIDLAVRSAGTVTHVGAAAVALTSVVVTLVGWALLAVLERTTSRPRRIWTITAVAVALLSLLGPLGAVTANAGLALAALHVTVAAVAIAGVRWAAR